MLGIIIGGRLGYSLFYGLESLLADPLFIFKINQGGMSFHGGLLGAITGAWWFARKTGRGVWNTTDFIAVLTPLGLFFGRLGNFIGGELWGRKTDVPWGMIFPNSIEYQGWQSQALYQQYLTGALNDQTRHPSQLYEAGLEGLLLLLIVWVFARKPRPAGAISAVFLLGYASFRFFVEFFREPDRHLQFIAFDWLTMGELLSIPMIIAGLVLFGWAYRKAA